MPKKRSKALILPLPEVVNKSSFRGDDLRRFVFAAVNRCGARGKVTKVIFYDHEWDTPYIHGLALTQPDDANICTGEIDIHLPGGLQENHRDRTELGQILCHEVDHVLGLDHKDMQDWWHLPASWVDDLPLRRKKSTIKDKTQLKLEQDLRDAWWKMQEHDFNSK